jgi:hypothetical protein
MRHFIDGVEVFIGWDGLANWQKQMLKCLIKHQCPQLVSASINDPN